MFHAIEAECANHLWESAASWFKPGGIATGQESRIGQTAEVMRVCLTLGDPRQRWIASRMPAMNPAFALAEVIWILSGRNDSAFVNYFNPKLPLFGGVGETYHGAYGYRLRRHFKVDQLERAWQVLSADADSRQVVLQIWDGSTDLPFSDGERRADDIPCNIVSLLKLRNNKLEWTQIMRSNDLFRGLPHNIVQFSILQEVLAGWLNAELGCYHHFTDSLHFYVSDGIVAERIAPCPLPTNSDSLCVPKPESDASVASLSNFCDSLISDDLSADTIIARFDHLQLPASFRNWASILCADALRRRREIGGMHSVLAACSNCSLVVMFERWLQRTIVAMPSQRPLIGDAVGN